MKRKALFLATLLATTALVGCGGGNNQKSSSSIPDPESSSLLPSSSSSEAPSSSSSLAPSSSSELPSSSSEAPSSSSSSEAPSSSSEAPSSSSELPSSSSEAPSSSSEEPSSSSNPGPTPMIPIDPDYSEEFDYSSKNYPETILTDKSLVALVGNESYPLQVLEQANYSGKNVNFTSSDETIATVDENGVITGVGSGETTVVVSDKDNPNFKKDVRVVVSPAITEAEAKDLKTGFQSAANEENIQAIIDNEMYQKAVYKNGELHTYDRWDQRITASKEDAYFRIWETDSEIKADGAAMEFTSYEWIFNTNVFYDTYLFHRTGDKKTYLPVATQSYMKDGDRVKPMIDILDNLFTSGSGIFNNTFENATLSEMCSDIGVSGSNISDVRYGSNGEKNMVLAYHATFSNASADLDDENRYGIPYGTPFVQGQTLRYTCVDNRIVAFDIDITQDYVNELTGDVYHEDWKMYHTYEDLDEEKSQIFIPNKKDYTRVEDLFEL